MYGIEELIALAAEKRASDVHLIAGLPPKCRIDGRIETLTDGGLTREDCEEYGRSWQAMRQIRSRPSDSWILVLRLRDGVSV